MKNFSTWKAEYETLDKLYHELEDAGFHDRAEKVADRLSEMELETVAECHANRLICAANTEAGMCGGCMYDKGIVTSHKGGLDE